MKKSRIHLKSPGSTYILTNLFHSCLWLISGHNVQVKIWLRLLCHKYLFPVFCSVMKPYL
jgi:hypothetical protein